MAAVSDFVKESAVTLTAVDYEKMREIARAVHDDAALFAAFERSPEATAKAINGFEVPEGFHLHIADAQNRLYPAEEPGVFGAADKGEWSRIEFRVGYKSLSLVACASPA